MFRFSCQSFSWRFCQVMSVPLSTLSRNRAARWRSKGRKRPSGPPKTPSERRQEWCRSRFILKSGVRRACSPTGRKGPAGPVGRTWDSGFASSRQKLLPNGRSSPSSLHDFAYALFCPPLGHKACGGGKLMRRQNHVGKTGAGGTPSTLRSLPTRLVLASPGYSA